MRPKRLPETMQGSAALKVNHDIHVHTYLSACCPDKAGQRPENILRVAEQMALATVGFADHMWLNHDIEPNDWYGPQDENQIVRLREDLSSVSTDLRVLVGCEAEMIAPGKFGVTSKFADNLDFVLLSCSHFHMKGFVAQPRSDSPRDVAQHMLSFFASGVSSGLATSIAHPFMPLGYVQQYDAVIAAISDAAFLDAFGMAAEHGVGLEVSPIFLPPAAAPTRWNPDTPVRFLRLAKEAGCKFTFGTDAHEPAALRRLSDVAHIASQVGITEEDLLPMLKAGQAST